MIHSTIIPDDMYNIYGGDLDAHKTCYHRSFSGNKKYFCTYIIS